MILLFVFFFTAIVCIIYPKRGVFLIFLYAFLSSNAQQYTFAKNNKALLTPFSFIHFSGYSIIDHQGIRWLIIILLLSIVIRKTINNTDLIGKWLLKIIIGILAISIISLIFNGSPLIKGIGSVSILLVSFAFLFSVLNLEFSEKEIFTFLNALLFFVFLNSLLQIYQFIRFSNGDPDLNFGLLANTTPTSILAFVVTLLYIPRVSVKLKQYKREGMIAIFVVVIQILASYIKGIFAFLISFFLMITSLNDKKRLVKSFILLGVIFVLGFGIVYVLNIEKFFSNLEILYPLINSNVIFQIGPIKVWTQFFSYTKSLLPFLLGYGPGSYGSVNMVNAYGLGASKLGNLLASNTIHSSIGIFGTALSTLGNILWEEGIIVLILFIYAFYKIYIINNSIAKNTDNKSIFKLSIGIKYNLIFIFILYLISFRDTTNQLFLWGPSFFIFSYVYIQNNKLSNTTFRLIKS